MVCFLILSDLIIYYFFSEVQEFNCLSFSLGSFTICNATIVTCATLNFEETPSIMFTLYLQDPFNLTYFQTFELKVVDQNDKPTDIRIERKHIAFVKENSPYEAIGILETTDEDFNQNHK